MPDKADKYGIPLEISDILEALPFYVMLVDEDHLIIKANRAVHEHLGVKPDDIIGKYCPEIVHGLKEPWYACPLEEAAEKGIAVEREAMDEKTKHWIRSAIYPIGKLTPGGKRVFFHMVSDISERKEAEQRAESASSALRTYAAHIVNSQEEERKRIARELHDDTIQTVALLCRKLENISAEGSLSSPAVDELREAKAISEGIMDRLRHLARGIRPPILDDLGIVASIGRLLLDVTQLTGMEGKIQQTGEERRLLPEVEIGIFRIAQEALWNIGRHSRATSVVVTVIFAEDHFGLELSDNGIGFTVPPSLRELSSSGHLGLLGMQERIELVGGKLEIQSSPNKGTKISIVIPISPNGNNIY